MRITRVFVVAIMNVITFTRIVAGVMTGIIGLKLQIIRFEIKNYHNLTWTDSKLVWKTQELDIVYQLVIHEKKNSTKTRNTSNNGSSQMVLFPHIID